MGILISNQFLTLGSGQTENTQIRVFAYFLTHYTQGRVNIVLTFKVPNSNGLGFIIFWRFGGKGRLNQQVTKVFEEQPRLHQVCYNYTLLVQITRSGPYKYCVAQQYKLNWKLSLVVLSINVALVAWSWLVI